MGRRAPLHPEEMAMSDRHPGHWIQKVESYWVPEKQDWAIIVVHRGDCPACRKGLPA